MERLYDLTEAAKILGIPLSWLYERSRRNALPGQVRLGRYVRVNEAGLRAMMGRDETLDAVSATK